MCKTPPNYIAVRYETREKALRQALGSRDTEIGIASFMDNTKIRKFERTTFARRFPVKTGNPGRPRKSKNAKFEAGASFGVKKLPPANSRKRQKASNKDLVESIDCSPGLSDMRDLAFSADESSTDSDAEAGVHRAEGEEGGDGEEAVQTLEKAMLMDEASSEEEDEEMGVESIISGTG